MASGFPFRFAGHDFIARAAGTLWWPREQALLVSDLHLGKSTRMARRGGALLPPWDTIETLSALHDEIKALDPARVISMGDSYDDPTVMAEFSPEERALFEALQHERHWDFIEGNHDPATGGQDHLTLCGIELRHEIGKGPDISGHFHPSIRLGGKRWRCFTHNEDHLILPSFGRYTGGLDILSPDFKKIMPKGNLIAGVEGRMFSTRFG